MDLPKSTELLIDIISSDYDFFAEPMYIDGYADVYANGEFDAEDWDRLIENPVFYVIVEGERGNSTKRDDYSFWLMNGGFSEETANHKTNGGDGFEREELLYETFVKEYLETNENVCPIEMITNLPPKFYKIMKEVNYFEKYDIKELTEIYKLTNDSEVLLKETQSFFFADI